ncbi:MAG: DUF885 domain-containing protein [Dehalococcoidia bacterium]|nr:DUF885 domain-containing protein [Dehalococcoidia bacterium]
MSRVYDISGEYVERMAALHPVLATAMGVPGHDAEMSDYSPEGLRAINTLERETLAKLAGAPVEGERDRVAKEAMEEQLNQGLEQYDAGEHLRALNIIASPLQAMRMCFDLMPRATEEDWKNVAARLNLMPRGLASYRAGLDEGVRRNLTVAKRQARECAKQAEAWSGTKGEPSYFDGLVKAYDASGAGNKTLWAELTRGVSKAAAAYADTARYLRDTYLNAALDQDAVGRERYSLAARAFTGEVLDLEETYRWGWEQLRWVESEMEKTAEKILPGGGVEKAKKLLETDPARAIKGVDAFQKWMQDLQERTIAELDGVHFDLPGPVKRIEALIAPPGGALAMYYTGPAEDFSRPGRTWYPTGGKTRFPLWGEVSIAYHEGVPGHHFQIATALHLKEALSRFQRLMGGTSGYVEGWALYAERLMGELGYLDNPDYYLGMLRAQALRSVRVVIDLGMHLKLAIPKDQRFHPGEVWTPELGLEFIRERSHFPPDFVASEINRYLGWPGQAISYKVGERAWLEARERAKRKAGGAFDLKAWHNRALNLGPMGLTQMKREMVRG